MPQEVSPIRLSAVAAAVQPSATLAAGARARQLKAEGVQVFDFSLGEPDFPTPEHICQAAVQAMKAGHTRYTPAAVEVRRPGQEPGGLLWNALDVQREADRVALARYAPVGVVIDETMMVLQFRGRTAPYLEPAPGMASLDLMRMLREGLLGEVRAALNEAKVDNGPVVRDHVRITDGNVVRRVKVEVLPFRVPPSGVQIVLTSGLAVPSTKPNRLRRLPMKPSIVQRSANASRTGRTSSRSACTTVSRLSATSWSITSPWVCLGSSLSSGNAGISVRPSGLASP